jgi:hypothetical protein
MCEINITVGPLYLQAFHSQIQPNVERKYLLKNCVCTKPIQVFFLGIYSLNNTVKLTTIYVGIYIVLSIISNLEVN